MSDMDTTVPATGEQNEPVAPMEPAIKEMMDAGVFFGRSRAKTHPRVKQHIIANRNGIDIINLEKSQEQLQPAMEFLKGKVARNANMILVATQPPAHEMALKMGAEFSMPVVTLRWLGGTLTNYRVIARRVEYFKKLKADLASGAFSGYTKKEQLDLQKEATKMEEIFSGLEAMAARPDVLLVIDPVYHKTGVAEAKRLGIPVVALANTDTDPDSVDQAVLGNTKSRTAINWFLEHAAAAIREGRKEAAMAKEAAAKEAALAAAPAAAPKEATKPE